MTTNTIESHECTFFLCMLALVKIERGLTCKIVISLCDDHYRLKNVIWACDLYIFTGCSVDIIREKRQIKKWEVLILCREGHMYQKNPSVYNYRRTFLIASIYKLRIAIFTMFAIINRLTNINMHNIIQYGVDHCN